MLKANEVEVIEVREVFTSLSDMAQNQAKLSDVMANHARFAMQKIIGFPESEPSKEQMAELNSGYHKQYAVNHPTKTYARISDALVDFDTLTKEQQAKVKEKLNIGVDYVLAISTQKFAKMKSGKDADPAMHSVLKTWRDGLSNYRNTKYKNLVTKCKELMPKADRTRKPTEDFIIRINEAFDSLEKSCKVASGKGDASANPKQFTQAKIKFLTEYKKDLV